MRNIRNVQVKEGVRDEALKTREQEKEKEQKIKEILLTAAQRRRANKAIDRLLTLPQFRGRGIVGILEAMKRQVKKGDLSRYVLTVALDRAKRQKHEVGSKDAIFLAQFEDSLESE